MPDHLDEDFLDRILGRLGILKEAEREVVDPTAVTVVNLRSGREIARLNDTHQLLIAQVVHLPCFSLFRRWHQEKVTEGGRVPD